ncbi:MAG: TRAM domain-containing protein [Rhodospirillaceae bacterium]
MPKPPRGRRGPKVRGRPRRPRPSAKQPKEIVDVTVDGIAAQGDAEARTDDGRRLFIPYAAPGDRVRAAVGAPRGEGFEASVAEQLEAGPRQEPFCPQFGQCGGCSVQHLTDTAYRDWKTGLLRTALGRRGLAPDISDMAEVPRAARRRLTFSAANTGSGAVVGFMASRRHEVVPLATCPLADPGLNALLPALKDLMGDILGLGERARIALARLAAGIDMVLERDAAADLPARERLAAFADANDLARLSLRDGSGLIEPLAQRRPVEVDFGGAAVPLPPDGFMQPTAAGEAALTAAVTGAASGAVRIIELYAGAGTFTLPLAKDSLICAVDGDADLVGALKTAAGRAGLGGRVTAEARDLAARPLLAAELAEVLPGAATVVLDPPRAGALAQVREIVEAPGIRRVVMVSCNPATFARDARVLTDGRFAMGAVLPVDQFPWSHHLECVAVFER